MNLSKYYWISKSRGAITRGRLRHFFSDWNPVAPGHRMKLFYYCDWSRPQLRWDLWWYERYFLSITYETRKGVHVHFTISPSCHQEQVTWMMVLLCIIYPQVKEVLDRFYLRKSNPSACHGSTNSLSMSWQHGQSIKFYVSLTWYCCRSRNVYFTHSSARREADETFQRVLSSPWRAFSRRYVATEMRSPPATHAHAHAHAYAYQHPEPSPSLSP